MKRKKPMNFAIQTRMTQELYDIVELKAKASKISTAELIRRLLKEKYKTNYDNI